ncbi:MAG: 16S rRNA (cytosine(967)-C(5))-methyltransferase RsmB [Acidibacillus sp.]|uniref:16S rRNA (cytosine(967)-C(5))-methyltransferase n=1 Tax=Sulfoacidibacillus ferrooxidans TaxID=2005001 RepID=A0A9X1V9C2_9BACL|nr:16S rRNA (cytosine(967)-C(5))-methyltransferase RsmB [Sulfoacidibacillus ferrooxidans]MCI0184171.1 Ribosomal RNA small subunit methyltransferase B [Sulfoacidibacillus ferrooxidans]MCY0892974.1 16S rRNA (cytosine(967)-C(5))-methyltransferase RsmB [Acidibacillus sp.]
MKTKVSAARLMAYDVLWAVIKHKAYAHVALHEVLEQYRPRPEDAALASEIVHGVLTWERLLDHYISEHSSVPHQSLDMKVLVILRMSLYQLRFFSRVPSYAIVSDAVELTKDVAVRAQGFVNGVLRAATRSTNWVMPLTKDECPLCDKGQWGLRLSFPQWMVDQLIDHFGEQEACQLMCALNEKVPRTVRVNSAHYTREEVLSALEQEDVRAEPSPISPYGIRLPAKVSPIAKLAYRNGMYSLQGESSMLVAPLFGDLTGKRVLDACAAPGGKALHMAELAKDQAMIVAVDVHEHRAKMIDQQAKRLDLSSVQTITQDARSIEGQFDAVLLDAPCSGLGTIARKPDIKWRVTSQDIDNLTKIQAELLDAMSLRVQTDGLLIYTTCTLSACENEWQIRHFLSRHREFELEELNLPLELRANDQVNNNDRSLEPGMAYIFPQQVGSDGFFFAKLRRKHVEINE